MPKVRLNKYQQGLLREIWPAMPAALSRQLTAESVRDIALDSKHIAAAAEAISGQRAGCRCSARCRRLDSLLKVLASAE